MSAADVPATIAENVAHRLAETDTRTNSDALVWLRGGEPTSRPFGLRTAGEVAAEVAAMPPASWLWRRVWPSDAYGVLSAGWKVGKTWLVLDAAVAAASGSPWLGLFDTDRTGPVILFLGEGGARKMTRRGQAVARHYGKTWENLPIHLSERVPTLTNAEHVASLAAEVAAVRPVLVVIDPLYLAAGGADHKSLYGMGEVLSPAQRACQASGAALLVAHHTNRDKTSSGSSRMSGAGPAEWGRVLIAVERKAQRVDQATERTDVHLELSIEGDEVAGGTHRLRRQVWADDPDDIGTGLHYVVEPAEGDTPEAEGPGSQMAPSRRRVLAVLTTAADWRTAREIGDALAAEGLPLKKRTILDAAAELVADNLATVRSGGHSSPSSWRTPEADR